MSDDGQTALMHAEGLPVRWDLSVERKLAVPSPTRRSRRRLARAVRQDIWRALQSVRGFVPLVSITKLDTGSMIRAGGVMSAGGRVTSAAELALDAVLDDAQNRRRWTRYAALGGAEKKTCSKRS